MTDTREAFRFLQIFEAAVEEVGMNPDVSGEAFSELRRCVMDKVLREIRTSNGSKGREHET
jgi:hypothetical protein